MGEVLNHAKPKETNEPAWFKFEAPLEFPRKALTTLLEIFNKWTNEPLEFILTSTLACFVFCLGLTFGVSLPLPEKLHAGFSLIASATALATVLFTVLLHLGCYFRHGMSRYALTGGLIVWVVLSLIFIVEMWRERQATESQSLLIVLLFVIAGTGFVALIYTGLAEFATVLGGWNQIRREEIHDQHLTRHELLERYFELQSRLERSEAVEMAPHFMESWPLVKAFQRQPVLFAICAGFMFSIPTGLLNTIGAYQSSSVETPSAFFLLLLRGAFALPGLMAYAFMGYFGKSLGRAFGTILLARTAAFATLALPFVILHNDPNFLDHEFQYLIWTVMMLAIGWAAQVGSRMQNAARRSESLRRNDQATIVAEMLRIQWRLNDHANTVTVLAVDAARSSEMKSNADPLAVEYSFREYQNWVEAICDRFGGRVHNTAGDGAVVAFSEADSALRAARRLHTDLDRFNREDNRLSVPFRLRIGLHTGQIVGELDEVEFSEVIDIAAHVQGAAPIAGIAVTDSVASELQQEAFIALANSVDNHSVLLVANPTED